MKNSKKQVSNQLPEPFLERLHELLPASAREAVLRSFETPRPVSFRVNTLKAVPETVFSRLEEEGFCCERISWSACAALLSGKTLRQLQETPEYRDGHIYVQGLSSMAAASVLDPRPGERILDMTAAPGSKTTQIAALMCGQGELIANDYHRSRFYKLKSVLALLGADAVRPVCSRGETWGRQEPESFDRILLDAPCSSEGRFNTLDPKSFRYWKTAKIKEMASKQRRLLASALYALKPGGVLVYSTCTFAPEENEAILTKVLKKTGDAFSLEPIEFSFKNTVPGLLSWKGRDYDPRVARAVRILPDQHMSGFFIARIRKHHSLTEIRD